MNSVAMNPASILWFSLLTGFLSEGATEGHGYPGVWEQVAEPTDKTQFHRKRWAFDEEMQFTAIVELDP